MSTIDAAIIKALVEHVGGNPDSIPDGAIGGGKTYTEGDGISIVNDKIGVEYDTNTMELKNGTLAAKTQLTAGDGISISNGKANVRFNTNTMELVNGALSVKSTTASGLIPVSDVDYDTYDNNAIGNRFRVHFDDPALVLGKIVRFLYDGVLQEYIIIRNPLARKTKEDQSFDTSIMIINMNDFTYVTDGIQIPITGGTRDHYVRISVADHSKVTMPTATNGLGLFAFTSCDSRIMAAVTTAISLAIIERHKEITE